MEGSPNMPWRRTKGETMESQRDLVQQAELCSGRKQSDVVPRMRVVTVPSILPDDLVAKANAKREELLGMLSPQGRQMFEEAEAAAARAFINGDAA